LAKQSKGVGVVEVLVVFVGKGMEVVVEGIVAAAAAPLPGQVSLSSHLEHLGHFSTNNRWDISQASRWSGKRFFCQRSIHERQEARNPFASHCSSQAAQPRPSRWQQAARFAGDQASCHLARSAWQL
jgi:hypothetical protein